MAQQINNPVGFYFKLHLNGEDAVFQEISGLSMEIGVEEVISGGESRFVYKVPTGVKHQNLILKRGMVNKDSPLFKWCVSTIEEGLTKAIVTNDITVSLLDKDGLILIEWTFHNAYPITYSFSDLRSEENSVAMETIEFAYTFFKQKSN